jgi:S-adenosyl-L-methionine hydrolase (adenosine-forming)
VGTITVLTDFGLKDPYVGIMKGVMLSINPDLTIIDISHKIESQDVREAAFLVPEYYRYFPPETVHLCVVDPTVGSPRKGIIVTKEGHFFVGPDNGLFSLILEKAVAHEITNVTFLSDRVSFTFHGRDVFSPVAAHLTRGIAPAEFGPRLGKPVSLPGLMPETKGHELIGRIVRLDRFGNAITNISSDRLHSFVKEGKYTIVVGDLSFVAISHSYYENQYTALIGSSDFLEFGLFEGNIARDKGLRKGSTVTVRRTS